MEREDVLYEIRKLSLLAAQERSPRIRQKLINRRDCMIGVLGRMVKDEERDE